MEFESLIDELLRALDGQASETPRADENAPPAAVESTFTVDFAESLIMHPFSSA